VIYPEFWRRNTKLYSVLFVRVLCKTFLIWTPMLLLYFFAYYVCFPKYTKIFQLKNVSLFTHKLKNSPSGLETLSSLRMTHASIILSYFIFSERSCCFWKASNFRAWESDIVLQSWQKKFFFFFFFFKLFVQCIHTIAIWPLCNLINLSYYPINCIYVRNHF